MLIKFSKAYNDIKFSVSQLDTNVKFEEIPESIRIEDNNTVIEGEDDVFKFLLNKYNCKKQVKDIKRIRTTLDACPINKSFISYISLYHQFAELYTKGSLKTLKYLQDMLKEYNLEYLLFYLLKIQVGKIIQIEEVENSDKLYVEQVDKGDVVQIVSGLRNIYKKEELLHEKYLFITNIKKNKIMNIESNGMILCGKKEEQVEAFKISKDIKEGSRVYLEDKENIFEGLELATIDLKKTVYKDIFDKLSIREGNMLYGDIKVMIENEYVKSNISNGVIS